MLFKGNPKVEVNGETVLSVIHGMGAAAKTATEMLKKNGIKNPEAGKWYSQQMWLDAFKELSEKFGPATLRMIGKSIPENAQFPPEINSIETALSAIDVAYHMNHRLEGKVMFNPSTGEMIEGIGHYKVSKSSDTQINIVCDNPYPDEFDYGIIHAMALKFANANNFVKVTKFVEKGNRSEGGDFTTYEITWRN